jgi:hypothetical protein
VAGTVAGLPTSGYAAASSCDGDGPCVIVDVVGDGSDADHPHIFDLADLDSLHDIADATYTVKSLQVTRDEPVPEGVSLRALAQAVSVDPDAVTYAEVLDVSGLSHPLTKAELGPLGDNGFADVHGQDVEPAMYDTGGNGISYIRPLRSDVPNDLNSVAGSDNGYFQSDTNGALGVIFHLSGSLLTPTIHPTTTAPKAGVADAFSATVAPQPGTSLTYDWSFGDGSSSTAAAPSHAWSRAGTYWVTVTITGADSSSGSTSLQVTVGAPQAPTTVPTRPGTGKSHHPHNPVTGPNRNPGRHSGGTPQHTAPDEGPSQSPTTTPPTTPPPAPSSGAPSVPSTPTHHVRQPRHRHPQHHVPAAKTGTHVSGILLTSASTPVTVVPEPVARAAGARQGAESPWRVPEWLVLTVAALAVLSCGIMREWRPPLPRRHRGGSEHG